LNKAEKEKLVEERIQISGQLMRDSWPGSILSLMKLEGWIHPETVVTSLEESEEDELKNLDLEYCMDYKFKEPDKPEYGVGVRIQYGTNYATHTLRLRKHNGQRTEYSKLKQNIENGEPYPKYLLHVYVDSDYHIEILNMAIIPTKALIDLIEDNPKLDGKLYYDLDNGIDAIMRIIPWKLLSQKRYKNICDIRILYKNKTCHAKIPKNYKPQKPPLTESPSNEPENKYYTPGMPHYKIE